MNKTHLLLISLLALTVALTACSKSDEKKPVRPVPVSVTAVHSDSVDELELSDGRIESLRAPTIISEVAGRVVGIHTKRGSVVRAGATLAVLDTADLRLSAQSARADALRLEPMVANQENTVKRYQLLRKDGLVSQEMIDNAETQLATLRQQLNAARNQASLANRNLQKATITAPFAGQIEERLITEGEFIERGKPVFRLVAADHLQAKLPFPETVIGRIAVGQRARLYAAGQRGELLEATVTSVSPQIDPANNAFYVTVEFSNPGNWHPGGSVSGEVVVATRPGAILVPQVSVVRRPAGEVVYVINGDHAEQRIVESGVSRGGWVEIRNGLTTNDKVVVDGAAYLTDKAIIKVQEERQ